MQKLIIAFACSMTISILSHAQNLITPSYTFSKKKEAHLKLEDGRDIKGKIKDIDRKKWMIEAIKIKDEHGKTHKFEAEDIQYMYLMPSGFDKLSKAIDKATDVQKWKERNIDSELIQQGYAYFEKADVMIKKKRETLMMQLLNPGYSKEVKIYHDPWAKETSSVGMGGITVAGGHAKSYYIQMGIIAARKVTKKNYKKEFTILWGQCDSMASSFENPKWSDLAEHAITYSECQ